MRLSEWLKISPMSQSELARQLEITPGRVTQLLSEDKPAWPGRSLALKLAEVTGGAVTANDFLPAQPEVAE